MNDATPRHWEQIADWCFDRAYRAVLRQVTPKPPAAVGVPGQLSQDKVLHPDPMADQIDGLSEYKVVRYIKLGSGQSRIDKNCIENGYAYIGFGSSDADLFALARKGHWDEFWTLKFEKDISGTEQARRQRATSATTQVKAFFEADERTLWITFYAGKLFHGAFHGAAPPLISNEIEGCIRMLGNPWCDKDANGSTLKVENLSGNLTKVRGFQGTSCTLSDDQKRYLLTRLSGKVPDHIAIIDKAREQMLAGVLAAIKTLQPKDFELLVEIIFSRSWRRIGQAGGVEKYTDIIYENPLKPDSRIAVQVKSNTSLQEIKIYCNDEQIERYEKLFYVFHTPELGLIADSFDAPEKLEIVDGLTLSNLVIDSGLVHWLKEKSS